MQKKHHYITRTYNFNAQTRNNKSYYITLKRFYHLNLYILVNFTLLPYTILRLKNDQNI